MSSVADSVDTFTYTRVADSDLLASITGPVHSVEYLYEANRDVKTQVKNTKTPGTPAIVSLYVYTYDALGRREDRQQSGTAFSTASIDNFSYNPRSEVVGSTNDITSAFTFGYAYDNIGNRIQATEDTETTEYVSNELNQYTQFGVSAPWHEPLYDLDGNMTFDGETWTLTWNGENRLIGATDGTSTISFTYDYMGRLVQRDDGTTETFYVYDDWNRIATFTLQSSNFTLQSTNLWGLDLTLTVQGAGGVGGLLREGNAYPLFDANGNITQKLDDTGDSIMAVIYDPFGNIISGGLAGEYGFSTKPQDANLEWYYYGYRFYDPLLGRWVNRDPIGEMGGLNLKVFISNNSVGRTDYLGLCCLFELLEDLMIYIDCIVGEEIKHEDNVSRIKDDARKQSLESDRIRDSLLSGVDVVEAECNSGCEHLYDCWWCGVQRAICQNLCKRLNSRARDYIERKHFLNQGYIIAMSVSLLGAEEARHRLAMRRCNNDRRCK